MPFIRCSFVGGKILIQARKQYLPQLGGVRLGSPWRGLLLMGAAALFARGMIVPGAVPLVAAGVWSIACMTASNWRGVLGRSRAIALLERGDYEGACGAAGPLRAGSGLWWNFIAFLCQLEQWDTVQEWLAELAGDDSRDYLLALALLGQGQPAAALGRCPPRPKEPWLTLKAEALFKMGEWKKVLGMLPGATGKDKLEHTWLKGVSYYRLGQYKAAVKVLRLLVRQGGEEYGDAAQFLAQAETRVK